MTRQKQRRVVFQLVYSLGFQGIEQKETALHEFYQQNNIDESIPYIDSTLQGICEHWDEIFAIIEPAISNWKMNRVSAVCLAILRVAVYELKFNPEIPDRVAVNEAIELAKEFGEEESGKFVHGVLSNIAK